MAASKRRVGVDVNGSPSGPLRQAVSDVLKHHGYEAASADLSGDSEDAIASAAKKGKLAAVIVGEVRDGGKRAKLHVYAAGGDLIGEGSWTEHGGAKKLGADVERTLWARIGGALTKVKAGDAGERPAKASSKAEKPEKSEDSEEAEKADEKAEEPDEKAASSRSEASDSAGDAADGASGKGKGKGKGKGSKKKRAAEEAEAEDAEEVDGDGGTPALSALELGVGARFIKRTLTWANTAATGYDMPISPAIGLAIAWYPVAHFHGGWMSNLGLAVSAEVLPGYKSTTRSDGKSYPTPESDYWAGVRGRLLLGSVEGALTLGGGQHAFVFSSGANSDRATLGTLPDVTYTYARVGLDLRVPLPAELTAFLGAGYRDVLSGGGGTFLIQGPKFFSDAKISGLDVTAGVGYRVLPFLEGRAGFDLRRYAITTNATGGQPAVSSGTDQTLGIWVQAVLILDGAGGGAAAPAPKTARAAAEGEGDDSDPKPGHKDEDE